MTPTLENVVVRPNWFSFSAGHRASRSPWRRRLSPRRSCDPQGGRVLARRGSFRNNFSGLENGRRNAAFAHGEFGERLRKFFRGTVFACASAGDDFAFSVFGIGRAEDRRRKDHGAFRLFSGASAAAEENVNALAAVECFDALAGENVRLNLVSGFFQGFDCLLLVHFLSPVRPNVGLVLFSDHRLSQPLGFVNGKKKKSFDYFLGRKTGRKAYTHNPSFQGTPHGEEKA